MNLSLDTIIVGGGLAGACAAYVLSSHERVLLLEADGPAAGASGVAAGLANPLMGLRARPVWRFEEALDALHALLDAASRDAVLSGAGILRPARSAEQAAFFHEAARAHPHHAAWMPRQEVATCFPGMRAPNGGLLVRTGLALDVGVFVARLLAQAVANGTTVWCGSLVHGWGETVEAAYVEIDRSGESVRLQAGRVLLALGHGYTRFPELNALHLHSIKGQTVRVERPAGLAAVPPLAGTGYVVPDGDTLVVGSSYEHTFTDLRPTPAQTRRILEAASAMLPSLNEARVLGAAAGVRVTVPRLRLPMIGPLPRCPRVWTFTGLGSRGLLMAPLLARALPQYLARPAAIPPEIRVRLRPA